MCHCSVDGRLSNSSIHSSKKHDFKPTVCLLLCWTLREGMLSMATILSTLHRERWGGGRNKDRTLGGNQGPCSDTSTDY